MTDETTSDVKVLFGISRILLNSVHILLMPIGETASCRQKARTASVELVEDEEKRCSETTLIG